MICYIDSSVVLSELLGERRRFKDWKKITFAFTSVLMRIEVSRVLGRYRLQGLLNDKEFSESSTSFQNFLSGVNLYEISAGVVQRSCMPFGTVIGSLDAIHLSTALQYAEDNESHVNFVTFDEQLAVAAEAMGLEVLR